MILPSVLLPPPSPLASRQKAPCKLEKLKEDRAGRLYLCVVMYVAKKPTRPINLLPATRSGRLCAIVELVRGTKWFDHPAHQPERTSCTSYSNIYNIMYCTVVAFTEHSSYSISETMHSASRAKAPQRCVRGVSSRTGWTSPFRMACSTKKSCRIVTRALS